MPTKNKKQPDDAKVDDRGDYAIIMKMPAKYKVVVYNNGGGKKPDVIKDEFWCDTMLDAESKSLRSAKVTHVSKS